MAQTVKRIALNDGNSIPQLGLGVWQVPKSAASRVVGDAINAGYRHIDTAEGYENEEGVGEAVRTTEVSREEIFITSKLRNGSHARDAALREFDETMRKLGVEQLDLFLIHWPQPGQNRYVEAWKTLIELQQQGRIRSIGVSNFSEDQLERIIHETGVVPTVNQIELHPAVQQRAVRDYHDQKTIRIESYSPLGSGALIDNPTLKAIGRKHSKSSAQVMIRWHLDQDLIVIPKSANSARIRENIDVFDFTLDDDDRKQIAGLDRSRRY